MVIPELRQLLDALDAAGSSPFRCLTYPGEGYLLVWGVQIYDPRAQQPPRDGLLLAVGIAPSSAEAMEMIRKAAQHRCSCVIKSYGEPVADLVLAAEDAGIALVEADGGWPWHHIQSLLGSMQHVLTVRFAAIDHS
jgi:hypothetical protein